MVDVGEQRCLVHHAGDDSWPSTEVVERAAQFGLPEAEELTLCRTDLVEVQVVVPRLEIFLRALHDLTGDVGTARDVLGRVVLGDDLRRLLEVRPRGEILLAGRTRTEAQERDLAPALPPRGRASRPGSGTVEGSPRLRATRALSHDASTTAAPPKSLLK